MKRNILIAMALLLVVPLLSGCGVPQEEVDAALAEAQAAKSQLASAQSDLSKAKSDLSAVQSDLAAAESDLAAAESDLSSAQGKVSGLQSDLSKAESDLAAAQEQIAALEAAAEEAVVEEEVAEEEEAVEEEVVPAGVLGYEHPAELSFTGVEVTIADAGFSFQYPDYYTDQEVEEGFEAQDSTKDDCHGLWIGVYDAAEVDNIEAMVSAAPETYVGPEILNVWETALADGTPASCAELNATVAGWPMHLFALGLVHGDNFVSITVWSIDMFVPYNEELFQEIAHTLTLE